MEEDDEHEEAEEEPDAANHVRGIEDLTGPGDPLDHHQCPHTLDDHAGCEHREGNQDQVHGLASRELPDVPPAGTCCPRTARDDAALSPFAVGCYACASIGG